ncbi:MAG: calycin-like domain-containing protein [Muribaculaceae bacterium]|nr:calycin-like domain-containing protein [Muribaculaceae bacterium]
MTKKFSTLLLTAVAILPLSAQQLPNNGFEDDWVACVPWTSANNTKTQGDTPSPWTLSHTVGTGSLGKTSVGEKVAGYESASAVEIINGNALGNVIPGYFTIGTPWSTAKGMSGSNKDGGTFGGYDFTFQPDAVTFMYMAKSNPCSVVAYLWNGEYQQANVPGNISLSSCTTVTMIDRDRCILKEVYPDLWNGVQGGEITQEGSLVAYNKARPEITDAWTAYTLPMTYIEGAAAPEKINVIFSTGDYFTTPGSNDESNKMTVDDVKLLYYSRLASLTVKGQEIALEDGVYEYDTDLYMITDESAITYTLLGQAPTKEVSLALDADNLQATVTVKNTNGEGATDVDGESEHTYTLKFKAPRTFTGVPYPGKITELTLVGEPLIEEPFDAVIYLTQQAPEDKTVVDVLLPDLELPGFGNLGDILVENVKRVSKKVDGIYVYSYTGHVDDLALLGGEIHAIVDLEGTSDKEGNASFQIHVKWDMQYEAAARVKRAEGEEEADDRFVPIEVTFNGKADSPEVPTGISEVTVDTDANAPVEFFNLQGMRISNPQPGTAVIRRQGSHIEKVVVK